MKISDVNLFVFSSGEDEAHLEERVFVTAAGLTEEAGGYSLALDLLKGKTYDIYAAANLGYRITDINTKADIAAYRYHLAYPDEFRNGLPMSGAVKGVKSTDNMITIPLKRLVSRIDISVDRSELYRKVDYKVSAVRLRNCARNTPLFGTGESAAKGDHFPLGYNLDGDDVEVLNTKDLDGRSGTISLYCLENLQNGRDTSVCTYVEVEAEYASDSLYTSAGNTLKYRFFPGTNREPFSLRRGLRYANCVMPCGRGLKGDEWRIDRSGLNEYKDVWFKFYPEQYIECHIGDTVHIWCEYSPPYAKLVIDRDNLDHCREVGIWDYEIDENETGVYLYMKGPGMGMAVFEVEAPVDEGVLYVIMCEP